ncbi:MAG: DUF5063 domain-containing protein [Gemmatimonadales bacterium]|nr:DUF5063 domain-containing protein [Gemmatimonadales bacterium]
MPTSSAELTLGRFAALAARFCEHVEMYRAQQPAVFLQTAHRLLADIYAAALGLPRSAADEMEDESEDEAWAPSVSVESDQAPDPDRLSQDEWWTLFRGLTEYFGDRKWYREIFDPHEPSTELEVRGDLADDFADIYRDLLDGLRKWARGEADLAHWEWRSGFENHWGEHATGALRALHCLAAWHDQPWPDASESV